MFPNHSPGDCWNWFDPDERKAYNQEYYKRNKIKILARGRLWKAKHRQHVKRYAARYYIVHRAELILYARAYRRRVDKTKKAL